MRKKIKNTITFISLFIALVIFSHSILPHDHHFLLVGTHDNNDDDGSEKKSAHCFYFNDVIIQKSSLSSNIAIKKLVNIKVFAIKNILVQEALFAPKNYSDNSFYYPISETLSYTSPTRGSPFSLV